MTINKLPNQEDVQDGSGLIGWESTLHHRIPPEMKTSTTGNASVSSDGLGTLLECGTSAGDASYILGLDPAFAAEGLRKNITEVLLREPNGQPNDDVEVGQLDNNGVNADRGAYIDCTTNQFHVSAETQTFNLNYPLDIKYLKIVSDYEAGETRFYIGHNSDSASGTIQSVDDSRQEYVAGIKSNGNGDLVRLLWVRHRMEPYQP